MNNLYLLASERKTLARLKETASDLQEKLEQTQEYKALQDAQDNAKLMTTEVSRVEAEIKDSVEKEFVRTRLENTKPYDGIEIKKFGVVHILDERQAITWAATNAPQVLSLKQAPFNKIAKVLDLDFVQKTTEYRAQIASDLSMYDENENV